uniref:Uncharacterized protein n=1 Tax=Plectus sambesii TaxID=2011161 RepID=A0A914WQZ2_9BILA
MRTTNYGWASKTRGRQSGEAIAGATTTGNDNSRLTPFDRRRGGGSVRVSLRAIANNAPTRRGPMLLTSSWPKIAEENIIAQRLGNVDDVCGLVFPA